MQTPRSYSNQSESLHAYKFIATLCHECYIQPKVVERLMRKVFEDTLKYQNKLWSRICIDKLIKCRVGTNHIQNFAFNQLRRARNKNIFMSCINYNLKIINKIAIKKRKRI